jgi:hypothetical protein
VVLFGEDRVHQDQEAGLLQATSRVDGVKVSPARTSQGGAALWFPLVLFGVVILASVPLYSITNDGAGWGGRFVFSGLFRYTSHPGFSPLAGFGHSPLRLVVYWLVTVPMCYVVVGVLYRLQARREGVAHFGKAYVLTGLGVFVLLVGTRLPARA